MQSDRAKGRPKGASSGVTVVQRGVDGWMAYKKL